MLRSLNDTNGDQTVLNHIHQRVLERFKDEPVVYGAEFGIAYGGGVEKACHAWKDKGIIYAFDTFAGHPKHLSNNVESAEAKCMDGWYQEFGMDELSDEYIGNALTSQGLTNFKLVKGEVNTSSAVEIPKLHYVLLDLDIIEPMKIAYEAIKDKVVPGAFICVHDIFPEDHLDGYINRWWYNEVMPTGKYKEVSRGTGKYVTLGLEGEEVLRGRFIGVYEVL